MRYYRFFNDVRQMPLQFNVMGFRVSMPVVLLLTADLILFAIATVIGNQIFEGKAFTIYVGIATFIGIVIAATIMWWVSILTRMGPLPVEKQLRLLKESADLPVWTGINYIDNNKKEQIR